MKKQLFLIFVLGTLQIANAQIHNLPNRLNAIVEFSNDFEYKYNVPEYYIEGIGSVKGLNFKSLAEIEKRGTDTVESTYMSFSKSGDKKSFVKKGKKGKIKIAYYHTKTQSGFVNTSLNSKGKVLKKVINAIDTVKECRGKYFFKNNKLKLRIVNGCED